MYNRFGQHSLLRLSGALSPSHDVESGLPASMWVGQRNVSLNSRQLVRLLRANIRLLLSCTVLLTVLVAIASFWMRPTYEPVARVEIDPPGSETFSLEGGSPSAEVADYLETQVAIIKSDGLALDVVRKLHLDRNSEFVGKPKPADLAEAQAAQTSSSDDNHVTHLEGLALDRLQSRLSVTLFRNSRLVEVSYADHDPKLATQIVNTLVGEFENFSYQSRFEAIMKSSRWLTKQLDDIKQKVEESNRALLDYEKQTGILDVEDKQNVLAGQMTEISRQNLQAAADRIDAEGNLKALRSGVAGPDSIPQQTVNGVTVTTDQLFGEIMRLYVEARTKLANAEAIYGPNNSNLKKLQNEVTSLELQIAAEKQRLLGRLEANYSSAKYRESMTAQKLKDMKSVVNGQNEAMVQLSLLKHEAEANAELYRTLFSKVREAGIAAASKSSNLRVVDVARVPEKSTKPNRVLYTAVAFVMGTIGGLMLVLLKEAFDNKLRSSEDVWKWTGLPCLGLVPAAIAVGKAKPLPILVKFKLNGGRGHVRRPPINFVSGDPSSHQAEAFRNLQTAIMFYRPDAKPKTILVASPSQQEGKTTVAVNLALSLSKHAPTCLIDADIRRPQVGALFGVDSKDGLSDVLSGAVTVDSALHLTQHQNLTVLPAGLNLNAAHWSGSEKIREILESLTERFDYLVVDCPPLLPFADSRVLATIVDSVVLVGRYGATTDEALKLAAQTLRELHAPVMGVVINDVGAQSPYYEYYYGPHQDAAGSNTPETLGRSPRAGLGVVTLALGAAVLVCAVLLETLVGLRLGWRSGQVTKSASGAALTAQNGAGQRGGAKTGSAGATWEAKPGTNAVSSPASSGAGNSMAPVSEKKNAFAPPSTLAARSNVSFPPAGSLLHRVEPEYPEQARQQQIQGPVVLDVRIGRNGTIQDVKLLSGQRLLADAAIAAVRQWRFKPRMLQGHPVEMQTRVTVNFRIPT